MLSALSLALTATAAQAKLTFGALDGCYDLIRIILGHVIDDDL
jgi:hypothetical protein